MSTSAAVRKDREREHGRRIAPTADQVWRRHTWAGRRRLEVRWDDLRQWIGGQAARPAVLELGCGTGLWTDYLSQLDFPLTSIDISDDLLAKARARFDPSHVAFFCADIETMPFPDAAFDVVCGLSVLHHLNVPAALTEIRRVLRPGGKIWFSEPNMLNPQIMLQKNIPPLKRWLGDTPDETAFFRWPLQKVLARHQFTDIAIRPFDFLHPHLPEGLARKIEPSLLWMEKIPAFREIAGSLLIHARRGA